MPPALRRINRPGSNAILRHNPAEPLSTNCLLVMSRDSVFASVASLCAVYHEAAELIHQIRADKNFCMNFQESSLGTSAQDLESSLERGESTVRNQYERIHKRCGEAFAQGDRTCLNYISLTLTEFFTDLARDALQDGIIQLQDEVIANLRRQREQDTLGNFISLHDKCDSIQDRAILVLMQLQQRTITLGPVDALPFEPFSTVRRPSSPQKATRSLQRGISSVGASSSKAPANGSSHHVRKLSSLPSIRPITPPGILNTTQYSSRPESARWSKEAASKDMRESPQYKPMATTVTRTGLFGIGKRTKVEPTISPPENPLVDEYLAVAMEDTKNRMSRNASFSTRAHSASTSIGSICEPDRSVFKTWQNHQSLSSDLLQGPIGSTISSDSVRRPLHIFTSAFESCDQQSSVSAEILSSNSSTNYTEAKNMLPSEINEYASFCKGAWRQQIGDRKRAMEERLRPGGMYNSAKYYQCKQCKFAGRLIPIDKETNGFDMRVFKLVQGIQFRWEFMFKSHVRVKEACSDPTKATFGCIFCCAEGRGTPLFGGIQTFMNHLLVHREHLPTGEVLYRMNCLVGRQAAITEDFDINIISVETGQR